MGVPMFVRHPGHGSPLEHSSDQVMRLPARPGGQARQRPPRAEDARIQDMGADA